jgi:hypothetical protein
MIKFVITKIYLTIKVVVHGDVIPCGLGRGYRCLERMILSPSSG